jgi:PAS domain-containing protein
MSTAQRPLELILARNLMASLSTPALLTDESGALIFYNEAAGELLERRFEDVRSQDRSLWEQVGPFDQDGASVASTELPLTIALRHGSPSHAANLQIRTFAGTERAVAVSALPIVSAHGPRGAMAFFWPSDQPA